MSQKKPVNAWMRRHVRDPYVKQATRQGYRSRAAYKLIELDDREKLLRPGMGVIDLGAAPGGWSQVAVTRVAPGGRVVAVDVLAMQSVAGAAFILGDIRSPEVRSKAIEALAGQADLVLSDMAPNLTGVRSVDEARSQELIRAALEFAQAALKPGGSFLVKVFHGSGLDAVIDEMKALFRTVATRKPSASRSESSEVYVVCRGLLR